MIHILIPVSISLQNEDILQRKLLEKAAIEHIRSQFPSPAKFTLISQEHEYKVPKTENIIIDKNITGIITTIKNSLEKIDIDLDDSVFIHCCDLINFFSFKEFQKHKDYPVLFTTKLQSPFRAKNQNYSFVRNNRKIEIGHKKSFTQNPEQEVVSTGLYYFPTVSVLKEAIQRYQNQSLPDCIEILYSLIDDSITYDQTLNIEIDSPSKITLFETWYKYFKNKNTPKGFLDMDLVVPMAGNGIRFKNCGYETEKPLLPIGGKTLAEFATLQLPRFNHYHFIIKDSFDPKNLSSLEPVSLYRVTQTTAGQACSAQLAIENLDDNCELMVGSCDNTAIFDLEKFNALRKTSDVIYFSFTDHPNMQTQPSAYGWLYMDDKSNIQGVSVKKQISDDPIKDQAIVGIFYFKKSIYYKRALAYMLENKLLTNNEYYIDSMIEYFCKQDLVLKAFPVEHFICLGTPNEYESYFYFEKFSQEVFCK